MRLPSYISVVLLSLFPCPPLPSPPFRYFALTSLPSFCPLAATSLPSLRCYPPAPWHTESPHFSTPHPPPPTPLSFLSIHPRRVPPMSFLSQQVIGLAVYPAHSHPPAGGNAATTPLAIRPPTPQFQSRPLQTLRTKETNMHRCTKTPPPSPFKETTSTNFCTAIAETYYPPHPNLCPPGLLPRTTMPDLASPFVPRLLAHHRGWLVGYGP